MASVWRNTQNTNSLYYACNGWPWPAAETLRVSCILSINMPLQWSEGISDLYFSLSMISSLLKVESVSRLIRKKHPLVVAHKIEIYTSMHVYIDYSAADPEGAPTRKRGATYYLDKIYQNCMKMKIGLGEGGGERIAHKKCYYVDPRLQFILCVCHVASLRCCLQIGFSLSLIFILDCGCVISWE